MAAEQHKLDGALVESLPPRCYYIPNFITVEEEQAILAAVYAVPTRHWTVLSHRRLLSLPSQLTGSRRDTLLEASLPAFLLSPIIKNFEDLGVFHNSPHRAPNHCLVNEYLPGHGIMPHEDGPAYHPTTATVSLGSHTVLNIYRKNDEGEREPMPFWKLLQEPRSLLITTSDMYTNTLHGIEELDVDKDLGPDTMNNWELLQDRDSYIGEQVKRQTRVSLTYRDVLRVSKLGGALKFAAKR